MKTISFQLRQPGLQISMPGFFVSLTDGADNYVKSVRAQKNIEDFLSQMAQKLNSKDSPLLAAPLKWRSIK